MRTVDEGEFIRLTRYTASRLTRDRRPADEYGTDDVTLTVTPVSPRMHSKSEVGN